MKTIFSATDSQDAKNAKCSQIRREGKILDRFDRKKPDGVVTGFFIEWQGAEYFIRMKNGNTQNIRKLWDIEKEI
jgi:hypothetical protein